MLRNVTIIALAFSLGASAYGQITRSAGVKANRALVYHGKIVRPNGDAPTGSASLTVKVLSPDPSLCVLWSETQTVQLDSGAFSVELGHTINRISGAAGGVASDFKQAFVNNPSLTMASAQCAQGNSYTPTPTDDRLLTATFNENGSIIEIAGLPIKSVPFALQAEEIAGFGIANLAKISGIGSNVTYSPGEAQTLKDMLGGDIFFDMKSRAVKNVAAPIAGTDAATKAYVDSAIAALPTSSSGTVTSVGVSVPAYMSASGGPVTTSGAIALDFSSQTANRVFASPDGSAGAPSFRALAATDVPALDAAKIATGTFTAAHIPTLDTSKLGTGVLGAARGGTGIAPTAGDAGKFYAVNAAGNSAEFKTIVAGANVTITPTAGGIEIASTASAGGTVTSVAVGGLPLSVTNGSTSPTVSIAQANTTTAGYLSAADWNTFNSKQPAGAYLTSITSGNVTTALGYTPLSQTLAQNQVFIGDASNVVTAGFFGIAQMRNNLGTVQFPAACAAHQTLTWSAVTDVLVCSNIDGLNADKLTAGTLPAGRFPALTGAITTTAGSLGTTLANDTVSTVHIGNLQVTGGKIANGTVTYGKLQNVSANNMLLGRATAGAGVAEEITLGSNLAYTGTTLNVTGLGALADNGSVDLSGAEATGILAAARFPALTGAITTTAGGLATTLANNTVGSANITDNSIANADLRQGAARSVIGVTGNATANVADIAGTTNQVLRVDSAGTGLTFGAINLASSAAVSGYLPVANIAAAGPAAGNFLQGNGTWSAIPFASVTGLGGLADNGSVDLSGAEATGILAAARFPALTGDVTTTAGALGTTVASVGGQTAANVAAGAVLANAATSANTANAIVKRDANGSFIAGEIISSPTSNNQARFIGGNYGVIHRNDGANYYILLTASADQNGSWNALRPFNISTTTGDVNMGNGTLMVKHGGNVGIGTTTPSQKLDVVGIVEANGINVNGSAVVDASGYVIPATGTSGAVCTTVGSIAKDASGNLMVCQ